MVTSPQTTSRASSSWGTASAAPAGFSLSASPPTGASVPEPRCSASAQVLQPDRLLWRHVGLPVGEADRRCLLGDRLHLRPQRRAVALQREPRAAAAVTGLGGFAVDSVAVCENSATVSSIWPFFARSAVGVVHDAVGSRASIHPRRHPR